MLKRTIGIIGILIVWEIAARTLLSRMFPPVSEVLPALFDLIISGKLSPHIKASLINMGIGYGIAVITGSLLGIAIAEFRLVNAVMTPVVDVMRPIAALTLFPLLIIVLGLGVESKAFVIFWTSWPAIVLNTTHGITSVNKEIIEAGLLDGTSRIQLLTHIKLPLSLGTYMTGLRIGLSGGWISLISADMLGSRAGLGYAILSYSQTFRFPEMYGIIITIAAIGLTFNVFMAGLQSILIEWIGDGDGESPFLRFHDRAISFAMDTIKLRRRK